MTVVNDLVEVLRRSLGVNFNADRRADLERFLDQNRSSSSGEISCAEFLNGETYFFRYPLFLAVLEARLDVQPPDRPFRLLCAACSTGEEAYSAAFALVDRAAAAGRRVEIVGSDVRASAIAAAERAVYKKWSFRALAAADRAPYFEPDGSGELRVKAPYRASVRFVVRNLLDAVEDGPFDAILLCNATLYMHPAAAETAYGRMAAALRLDGIMMLAPSDPPPRDHFHRAAEFGGWSVFRRGPPPAISTWKNVALDAGRSAPPTMPPRKPAAAPVLPPMRRDAVRASEDAPRPDVLADPVWAAWANGALASAQDELRQRLFFEPDSPLWRFLHGAMLWEQGWLRHAVREMERASELAARTPPDAPIAGLCTAAELQGMIAFWRSRHG